MNYRRLGKTDLNVSEISIGCSGYWGNSKYSEKKAAQIINEAFDRGVNFFDTGHNYSNFNAEPRLGRIIKDILARNDRTKIIISTKGGSIIGSAPIFFLRPGKTQDFSPDAIEASCYESIKNLSCGYLDIFQLHGISQKQMTGELIERLSVMKKNGMYRYLGVNTHSKSELEFISRRSEIFDMVLLDYNVLQLDRGEVIDELCKSGIGVVAGTVLAQGHLVKGMIGSIKTGSFFWYLARSLLKSTSRRLADASKDMREVLSSISEMSSAQAAFAYILANKNISSCVFGTTDIDNCIEIIESSGKRLSETSIAVIGKAYEALGKTAIA
jgi:aryl-alcohol dehydrogenase-like predicted oxidoreductase